MNERFADTFYWLAMLNPHDQFHAEAHALTVPNGLVTSVAVQLEVLDALSSDPRLRSAGQTFWRATTEDPEVIVMSLDKLLLERALGLFVARPDKKWSFTDCISFEIMRERGITTALTGDHHFRQAGFQIVFSG